MKKLKEAIQLLNDLGLPEKQQNDRSALDRQKEHCYEFYLLLDKERVRCD
jgi:hypothetical protein